MRCLCLFSVLVLIGAAQPAQAQGPEDRAAIEKLMKNYLDAFAKRDLKAILACLAADVARSELDDIQQGLRQYTLLRYSNMRLTHWTMKPATTVRLRVDVEWQKTPVPEVTRWPGDLASGLRRLQTLADVRQTRHDAIDWTFGLAREKDGWRLAFRVETVDITAKALFAAKTRQQRINFLKMDVWVDSTGALVKQDPWLRSAGLLGCLLHNALKEDSAGQTATANTWLSLAEEVATLLGDGKSQGLLWVGKGIIQMRQGMFAEAERSLEKSVKSFGKVKYSFGEFQARGVLFSLYWQQGQWTKAWSQIDHMNELPVPPAARLPSLIELSLLLLVPDTEEARKQAEKQLDYVLKQAQEENNRYCQCEIRKIFGLIQVQRKNWPTAELNLNAALKLAQENDWQFLQAEILCDIGLVQTRNSQFAAARKTFARALALARDPGVQWSVQLNLGHLLRAEKEYAAAIDAYVKADAMYDRFRMGIVDPLSRIHFENQFRGSYVDAVACCHDAAQDPAASVQVREEALARGFQLSEMARSRTLAAVLANDHFFLRDLGANEKAKLKELRLAIMLAQVQEKAAAGDQQYALQQVVDKAKQKYENYLHKLFQADPDLKLRSGRFDPVSLEELGKTLLKPFPKTALLSYLVGKEQSLLVVLTWDERLARPRVEIHPLPIGCKELKESVNDRLRHYIGIQHRDLDKWAEKLYQDLVQPASASLQGKEHLIILADEILNVLPFAALRGPDKKYLVEHFSISYAPSMTVLGRIMEKDERDKVAAELAALVLGCPNAPGNEPRIPLTEHEAELVAAVFAVKAQVKAEATAAFAKENLEKARYIHLAVHGSFNVARPLYSEVILASSGADSGYLHAHDLLGMRLRARLVVLSACQTAAPNDAQQLMIDRGEGVVGMSWALFAANSPSHLLTLWNVGDGSSSVLMAGFYKKLAPRAPTWTGKISRASALREAQLDLLRSKEYSQPIFWAPYVLHGDFRP